jgi:hypothetical protein
MKQNACRLVFATLCISILSHAHAQITPIDPDNSSSQSTAPLRHDDATDDNSLGNKFWDRIQVGGNVGAGFGTFTYVDVSPLIGYRVTKTFTAGLGFTYQYVSVKDATGYYLNYKENIIGGRVYAEQNIFYGLFAHGEFEHLWVNFKPDEPYIAEKDQFSSLPLGLGYNFTEGSRFSTYILVLYNVLFINDPARYTNPYNSPWIIRIGFNVGL